jgi:hypothetical protein
MPQFRAIQRSAASSLARLPVADRTLAEEDALAGSSRVRLRLRDEIDGEQQKGE